MSGLSVDTVDGWHLKFGEISSELAYAQAEAATNTGDWQDFKRWVASEGSVVGVSLTIPF